MSDTCRISGKASSELTVAQSYQMMNLLIVCSFAARAMDTVVDGQDMHSLSDSIGHCLDLAIEMQGEIHDALEREAHSRAL